MLNNMNDVRNVGVLCLVFLLYFIDANHALEKDPVASLKNGGKLQGTGVLTSFQGRDFYAFRGIPYAEPPVGELRFKPPVPKAPWSNTILDVTKDGPVCVQTSFLTKKVIGKEDCLRINVYTRQLPGVEKTANDKSAVMVFIHGGAFMIGDGTSKTYSPVLLMDTDIVFVTFNYRLDAFGFLSTGDDASRGNNGLLDQILALKWVQENIEIFGGNPDRVTIFGESAGAASVSHHVLSPLSKGLFHGAIAMSGATTCPWAVTRDERKWSNRLATDLNCPTRDSYKLVECLRKIPAEDIAKITHSYMKISFCPIPFTPNVDGYFLPDHPLEILRSPERLNRVPVISGITPKEGTFFMMHIFHTNPQESLTSREFQTNIIDTMFGNFEPVKEVTELVAEAYLTHIDNKNEDQVRSGIINVISEGLFDSFHYETISLMSKAGLQTYAYSYNFESSRRFYQSFSAEKKDWGVSHADDLLMFFPLFGNYSTEKDQVMSQTMIKLWTNFAKYGAPVPQNDQSIAKWPSIQNTTFPIYHLNEQITVDSFDIINNKVVQFWTGEVRRLKNKEYEHIHGEL